MGDDRNTTSTMDAATPAYSKSTLTCTVIGAATIGILALSMFGTSFEATGEVSSQTCEVSASMVNLHHCNKGDYSISDFCEWERKGTLRSSFCAKQLTSVSLTYGIGFILVIATIMGCMHSCAGGVCQFCIAVSLCMLHSLSAIGSIILAVVWTTAKGDLPDLTYDASKTSAWHTQAHAASSEPGLEWAYVSSQAGFLDWGISYAVCMCYLGAAFTMFCAVCAFVAMKTMIDAVSIRIEMKQVEVENDADAHSFLDRVATTGVITHTDAVAAISSAGSPPNSPTHLATVVDIENQRQACVETHAEGSHKPDDGVEEVHEGNAGLPPQDEGESQL